LLRPIKANSGLSGFGHLSTDGLLITYSADLISSFIMLQYTLSETGSEFRYVFNDILLPMGCRMEADTPLKLCAVVCGGVAANSRI